MKDKRRQSNEQRFIPIQFSLRSEKKCLTENWISPFGGHKGFPHRKVSATGGHLASNLGVVELTIALHKVFNSPEDKIIWDVGHQAYVHKILTGRADRFDSLRQLDGLSGFPKSKESPP